MELEIQADLIQCYLLSHIIAVGVETASEMSAKYFREVPLSDGRVNAADEPDMEDHEFVLTFKGLWLARKYKKMYGIKSYDDWREWQGKVLRSW
jgi:hypothetical protein